MNLCHATGGDGNSDSSDIVKGKILDFSQLSSGGFPDIEARLARKWNTLHQNIGWMFLDPVAVQQLVHELRLKQSETTTSGNASMSFTGRDDMEFELRCEVPFPVDYTWYLRRFCSSFLRPSSFSGAPAGTEGAWTPMYFELKSRLAEVQQWAEVTEQLLNMFQYSHRVLESSWTDSFPGSQLPDKWSRHWEEFQNATLNLESESQASEAEGQPPRSEPHWDWAEFKRDLRVREQIWNQGLPRGLNPLENRNVARHLGLRHLGLNLEGEALVTIA